MKFAKVLGSTCLLFLLLSISNLASGEADIALPTISDVTMDGHAVTELTSDQGAVFVAGRVSDDVSSPSEIIVQVKTILGNLTLTLASDGTFGIKIPLVEDLNTITLLAIDGAGNFSQPVTLTVERTPIEERGTCVIYDKDTGQIYGAGSPCSRVDGELRVWETGPYVDYFMAEEVIKDELLLRAFEGSTFDFYYDLEDNMVKLLTDEKRGEFDKFKNEWIKQHEDKINLWYNYFENKTVIDVILGPPPRGSFGPESKHLMTIDTCSIPLKVGVSLENNCVIVKFSGPSGTSGYCYLTLNKDHIAIGENFRVLLDDKPISYRFIETSEHYYVEVEYTHSLHTLYVGGIALSLAFPISLLWIVVTISVVITILAIVLLARRRRVSPPS